jgi:hypothetical protein
MTSVDYFETSLMADTKLHLGTVSLPGCFGIFSPVILIHDLCSMKSILFLSPLATLKSAIDDAIWLLSVGRYGFFHCVKKSYVYKRFLSVVLLPCRSLFIVWRAYNVCFCCWPVVPWWCRCSELGSCLVFCGSSGRHRRWSMKVDFLWPL